MIEKGWLVAENGQRQHRCRRVAVIVQRRCVHGADDVEVIPTTTRRGRNRRNKPQGVERTLTNKIPRNASEFHFDGLTPPGRTRLI
jgi:hypothetical protein